MLMGENVLKNKSFDFALRCLRLCDELRRRNVPRDLIRQVLRSGTSIGANVKEGLFAQSKADFLTKLTIAKKEAAETEYWLELLHAYKALADNEAESMLDDCRSLIKLLVASCKTLNNRLI